MALPASLLSIHTPSILKAISGYSPGSRKASGPSQTLQKESGACLISPCTETVMASPEASTRTPEQKHKEDRERFPLLKDSKLLGFQK